MLLARTDAIKLADTTLQLERAKIENDELRIKLATAEELARLKQKECAEKVELCDAQVKTLNDQLTAMVPPVEDVPIFERPWFVASLTVLITAAITIPVTWLIVSEAR